MKSCGMIILIGQTSPFVNVFCFYFSLEDENSYIEHTIATTEKGVN